MLSKGGISNYFGVRFLFGEYSWYVYILWLCIFHIFSIYLFFYLHEYLKVIFLKD